MALVTHAQCTLHLSRTLVESLRQRTLADVLVSCPRFHFFQPGGFIAFGGFEHGRRYSLPVSNVHPTTAIPPGAFADKHRSPNLPAQPVTSFQLAIEAHRQATSLKIVQTSPEPPPQDAGDRFARTVLSHLHSVKLMDLTSLAVLLNSIARFHAIHALPERDLTFIITAFIDRVESEPVSWIKCSPYLIVTVVDALHRLKISDAYRTAWRVLYTAAAVRKSGFDPNDWVHLNHCFNAVDLPSLPTSSARNAHSPLL